MGNVLYKLGRCEEALEAHKKAFKCLRSFYGKSCNDNITCSLLDRVETLIKLNRFEEALVLCKKVLKKYKSIYAKSENYSSDKKDVFYPLTPSKVIADYRKSLNDLTKDPVPASKKIVAAYKKLWQLLTGESECIYLEPKPSISISLKKLGRIFDKLGLFEEALAAYAEIVKISEKQRADDFDYEVPTVFDLEIEPPFASKKLCFPNSLSKAGKIYCKLNYHEEELSLYKKALEKY